MRKKTLRKVKDTVSMIRNNTDSIWAISLPIKYLRLVSPVVGVVVNTVNAVAIAADVSANIAEEFTTETNENS